MKTILALFCAVAFGLVASANPGFFGLAPNVTYPTTLPVTSGLIAQFIADGASSSDGDAVATWSDASGNGHNATQASGGAQPAYKTAIANGHAAIRFSGSQLMQTAGFSQGTTGSIVVAFSQRGSVGNYSRLLEIGANSNIAIDLHAAGPDIAVQFGGTTQYSLFTPTTNVPAIASVVMDSGAACAAWLNGVSAISGQTADSPSSGSQVLTIGDYGGGGGYYWNGDILEIIEYDHPLSTADRKAIERYLGHKYGIAVTP